MHRVYRIRYASFARNMSVNENCFSRLSHPSSLSKAPPADRLLCLEHVVFHRL